MPWDRLPHGAQEAVSRAGPAGYFRILTVQTILLFSACFFALGNIALLANWLATFMYEMRDLPIETFAFYMIIGYFGGAGGTLVMGWLMDRVNPYWLIAGYFIVDAAAILSLGYVPPQAAIAFVTALVVWNFCQVGGQKGSTTCDAELPARKRSSVSWAGGVGGWAGCLPVPWGWRWPRRDAADDHVARHPGAGGRAAVSCWGW